MGFWEEGHKRSSITLIDGIRFDHAIPVDVNLVSRLGELFSFCTVTFLFDSLCVPSGKVIVCASYFRWELCFTSLKAEELCKLFKIILCDMFLSLIYSVIYIWSYRLMNIYFILCFQSDTTLFCSWSYFSFDYLGHLSFDFIFPLTCLQHYGFVILHFFLYTFLHSGTIVHTRLI